MTTDLNEKLFIVDRNSKCAIRPRFVACPVAQSAALTRPKGPSENRALTPIFLRAGDDDLSDVRVGFHIGLRRRQLGEGEHAVDERPNAAASEKRQEIGDEA